MTYLSVIQLFRHFAQSTAVSLPCSVQHFKTIEWLKQMLWTNEISRKLGLRWVSDGYSILYSPWYWQLRPKFQKGHFHRIYVLCNIASVVIEKALFIRRVWQFDIWTTLGPLAMLNELTHWGMNQYCRWWQKKFYRISWKKMCVPWPHILVF